MTVFAVVAAVLIFLGAGALALQRVLIAKLLWVLGAVSVIALAVGGIQARNVSVVFVAVFLVAAIAVIFFVVPSKSERS